MLNSKLSRSALSLILAMMLVFSLFTVGVFAEETDFVTAETGEVTADGVAAGDDDVASGETEAETTEEKSEEEHDHEHETTGETETTGKTEEKKGMSTFDIISLIILGVLVVIGLIYCLKNREKVGKFLRSLRSEFKKISWSSWKDVRKNTFVVIVVVIAVALVIAGMDFLFSRGILAMKNLLS